MANTLRFKRGLASGLPTGLAGEPLFTTDTFDLYIGNGTGNTRFQKYIASGTTSQLLRGDGSLLTMPIVLTSPSNGQVLKYNGTSWVNDSDAGITGSGTTNYLPKFTGASTLGNSTLQEVNGNLGLGSAPSNWTSFKALQIGGNSFVGFGTQAEIWNNSFFDGTFKYYGNGFATRYTAIDGTFQWYIAPNNVSGAGATATFTQAARITSGGNFIINNASTDNGLRFQVTGNGYFSGSVGIGTSSLTGYGVRNSRNITGALACFGFSVDGTIQSDATSSINIFNSVPATQAATFNIGSLIHFIANQGTQGAGSTINNQYGFLAQAGLTGATNNYGFFGNIASGTGRWNLYMNGTAANYLNGSLSIGTTTQSGKLYVTLPGINTTFDSGTAADARIEFRRAGTRIGYLNWDSGVVTLQADSGNYLGFNAGGSERARIDASGNLGLGVTPSAWESTARVFQFGNSGTIYNNTSDYRAVIGSNVFNNSAGTATYLVTAAATQYMQISGTHRWFYAASGTAGNSITFTEGMRLDASGNLGLGLAPVSSLASWRSFEMARGSQFLINTNGDDWHLTNNAYYNGGWKRGIANLATDYEQWQGNHIWQNAVTGAVDSAITWVERMRLDASGNLGLGVVPSAWSGLRALQVGTTASLGGLTPSGEGAYLSSNAFFNGSSWIYQTTATSSQYVLIGGQHRWFSASSGTAGNSITFTEAMRLFLTGNLAVGTTTDAGYKLDVNGTMRVSGASTFNGLGTFSNNLNVSHASNNAFITITRPSNTYGSGLYLYTGSTQNWLIGTAWGETSSNFVLYNVGTSTQSFKVDYSTNAATFSSSVTLSGNLTVDTNTLFVDSNNNNVGIGTTTPSYKLQVVGSFGASTSGVTLEYNNGILYHSGSYYQFPSGSYYNLYGRAGMGLIFGSNNAEVGRFDLSGNLGIGMTPSYKLDVTGSARVSDAIAIGTTPDTNLPFKILKNINSTVGIRFENTSTGASSFTGYQFGTDVSGGTAFTNFLYASSGVAETGVYKPNGTALINTGSGGLNFLAVSQPIRFFTSTGNGTLRAAITNDGDFTQYNGTNPSASTTDAFRMYSADITAGNAAPHFRTENGGIIKLYQQTTGVTSATYIGGAGTGLTDSDTFDGYTIAQIVKALRNAGLLA